MNRITLQILAVAAVILAAPVAAREVEPPVPVNLEKVPAHLHARIEAKAKEGITPLRQYLQQTQHIHGVRIEQVVRWDEMAAMAKARDESKLADVGKKAAK